MHLNTETQRTSLIDDYLLTWVEAFLIDRKARGTAKGTLTFYSQKLKQYTDYCEGQAVKNISQITPGLIREFILWMQQGHNPGGVHAAFRALRAFLKWFEQETDERTAISKVKAPRVGQEPLEGVSLDTVKALVKNAGDRDKAALFALFDTGCRAREFLDLNVSDVNPATGEILIRKGKGGKPRYVYLGRTARKALRKYLKTRIDNHPALWLSRYGDRLSYDGLRGVITRRAKEADIQPPAIHDFRRGFALAMLRAGVDLYTLAKLMGHEGIQVLSRYLRLTDQDAKEAHRQHSPIDSL